jgi:hypothetical protein
MNLIKCIIINLKLIFFRRIFKMMHLISNKLVEFVEKHSDVIITDWINRLTSEKAVSTFSSDNLSFVRKKAEYILNHLNKWISYDTTKQEIGKRFAQEGRDLFNRGIPLCEVFRSTVLLRRVLWLFVVNESGFDSAFQLHQMRELNDRIVLFFDRSHFYVTRGYMEEMNQKMKELWNLTKEDTEKILFNKSFYNR